MSECKQTDLFSPALSPAPDVSASVPKSEGVLTQVRAPSPLPHDPKPTKTSSEKPTRALKPGVKGGGEDERFLSVRDVASRYAVSVATIWRHTNENPSFPKPVKILNGSTRWRISDLCAYEAFREGAAR